MRCTYEQTILNMCCVYYSNMSGHVELSRLKLCIFMQFMAYMNTYVYIHMMCHYEHIHTYIHTILFYVYEVYVTPLHIHTYIRTI